MASSPPLPGTPTPPPDGPAEPTPDPVDVNPICQPSPSSSSDDDDDASTTTNAEAHKSSKKQKTLASVTTPEPTNAEPKPKSATNGGSSSKKKKKNNNVWTKPTSRKGKKKTKQQQNQQQQQNQSNHHHQQLQSQQHQSNPPLQPLPGDPNATVFITPVPRFPDRSDDSPDATICLSRAYKAERVELSEDRLTAGSTKGYRMVRATRGVSEGAWYFEIRVLSLGETGHTRLGWTTDKGDLQAPVGYDGNSFGYRDIDGSKVHKSIRVKYGDVGYTEGDVVGFYINLPDGQKYAPKPPNFVWYKGQRYMYPADGKDDQPNLVPGSEISFFKNGICQGVAFTDLCGGRYYPAASMYTLPNQPNCEVRFNFGPNFDCFPQDFGGRPIPQPMIEVPYHGYDARGEVALSNGLPEKVNATNDAAPGEVCAIEDGQSQDTSLTAPDQHGEMIKNANDTAGEGTPGGNDEALQVVETPVVTASSLHETMETGTNGQPVSMGIAADVLAEGTTITSIGLPAEMDVTGEYPA